MKEIFLKLNNALNEYERRVLWLGIAKFCIGFALLIYVLTPPEWFGWQATKGEITDAKRIDGGLFGGGTTLFIIQFNTTGGQVLTGTYRASPIILGDFDALKVYYFKSNPTHFYVYNPNNLVIALTVLGLGFLILLSFYLYYKTLTKKTLYQNLKY